MSRFAGGMKSGGGMGGGGGMGLLKQKTRVLHAKKSSKIFGDENELSSKKKLSTLNVKVKEFKPQRGSVQVTINRVPTFKQSTDEMQRMRTQLNTQMNFKPSLQIPSDNEHSKKLSHGGELKYDDILQQLSHRSNTKQSGRHKKNKSSKRKTHQNTHSNNVDVEDLDQDHFNNISKKKSNQIDQDISQKKDQDFFQNHDFDQELQIQQQQQELLDEQQRMNDIFDHDEDHQEEHHQAELFEQSTGLDIRISNEMFNKIKVAEYISVFFSCFGVGLSVLLFEMKKLDDIADLMNLILAYNCFCTLGLILSIYFRYDLTLKWYISKGLLTEFDTISNTGWWKGMICEIIINIVAPYPFLYNVKYVEHINNGSFQATIQYDVNDLLLFFCFIRIYLLCRYTLIMTQFMNPRSQRVCQMNGCEANSMFAIKSIMKQKPYTILWTTMVVSTVIFGYQLRIFEGPVSQASGQDFNSMINSMWNVLITMTTVGYGDIYPKSLMGRVVGVIVCFWGVFIVSFFVVTLNNMLTFSPNEEKSYNLLLRLYYKEELKFKATQVLSSAFRQKNIKQKQPYNKDKILSSLRNFRSYMIDFQQAARTVRSFYEADTDVEIMQKLIENLMEDVSSLKEQQDSISSTLNKISEFILNDQQKEQLQ
eukprot:403376853